MEVQKSVEQLFTQIESDVRDYISSGGENARKMLVAYDALGQMNEENLPSQVRVTPDEVSLEQKLYKGEVTVSLTADANRDLPNPTYLTVTKKIDAAEIILDVHYRGGITLNEINLPSDAMEKISFREGFEEYVHTVYEAMGRIQRVC